MPTVQKGSRPELKNLDRANSMPFSGITGLEALLVKNPSTTFLVNSRGESMKPVVQDGDLLLIDRSLEPHHGNLVLASVNDSLIVRQLFQLQGITTLLAVNPEYSGIDVTTGFDFYVWGVVISLIRQTNILLKS